MATKAKKTVGSGGQKAATEKKTKKSSTKVKSTKKSKTAHAPIQVTIHQRVFGEVPAEHSFYLGDGRELKSIVDLTDALETMSDEIFNRHVSEAHNDFANWIQDLYKEESLAQQLREITCRMETQRRILKHIVKKLTE